MRRLVTFTALLALAVAQNGYDYNRPGRPFAGKPFASGTTPSRPGQSTATSNSYGGPTPSSVSSQPEDYSPIGGGSTPGFSTPQAGNQGYQGGANQRPQQSFTGQGSFQSQNGQGAQGGAGSFLGQNYPDGEQNTIGQGNQGGIGGQGGFGGQGGRGGQGGFGGQAGQGSRGEANFGSGQQSGFDNGQYEGGDYSAIPGEPDRDYPILSEIPETSFRCSEQPLPGYYADVETRCQVFHICSNNMTYDFLCPNGTIFSQENFVCVWWNQFDCNSAPDFFQLNGNLYDYSITGSQGGAAGSGAGFNANAGSNYNQGQPGAGGVTGPDFTGATGVQAPSYTGSAGGQSGFTGPDTQEPSTGYSASPAQDFQTTGPAFPSRGSNQNTGSGYETDSTLPPSSYTPSGFSSTRPQGGSEGYQSGRPSGPRFPSNRPGQGFQSKPTREYLPPRN